jgi:autotransporter-associated beta strand protein
MCFRLAWWLVGYWVVKSGCLIAGQNIAQRAIDSNNFFWPPIEGSAILGGPLFYWGRCNGRISRRIASALCGSCVGIEPMKLSRLILVLVCFAGAALRFDCAARADLWWDTNGATAGSSSGTTAPGVFEGVNWTTNSAGTSATQSWVPGETAVFAAGTNANYNPPTSQYDGYVVSVSTPIQVAGLKVEEGYPYLNAFNSNKTLTFTNGALAVDVAANAKLHVNMLYGPTNGVITKTGEGQFTSELDQTSFAGKWIVNGGQLFASDNEFGLAPAVVVPDLVTLNNGAGLFGYDDSGKRGITLGPGGGGFTLYDNGLGGFPPAMGWYGPITGTGPFVIQVHGFAYWGNSNNNYTGDTIIKDGIVSLEAANTIPATSDVKIIGSTTTDTQGFNQTIKSLSMIAGSYLNISPMGVRPSVNSTITLQNPAGETIAGKIDGGGTLVKNGTGAVTITGANGAYNFTLNNGTVGVGNDLAFGSGANPVTANGGTFANTAATNRLLPGININGDFGVDGSMNAAPGKLRFSSAATLNATHTITVGSNANLALTDLKQSVAGVGLTKAGAGTLEIWKTSSINNSPLTGPIKVLDGRIQLWNGATLGSGTNELNLAGGAFDVATSGQSLNNPLNVTADSSITTSTPNSLTLASNSISGTGKLTIRNDSPTVGSAFGVSFMGRGASFVPGPIEIANGTFGKTVLHSTSGFQNSETFANVLSGTGSFDVTGGYVPPPNTGATTLSAANTYSGGTTVSGGLLLVNNASGSGTGTGPVSVSSAGRLGGTGTIAGAVTNSGTIAPGAGVGTLTMSSDLTMTSNSHLAIDLSGASADQLVVGGNLDLSSNDFLDVTGSGAGPWVIATYAGTRNGTFDNVTSGYLVNYTTPGQIVLSTIALPGDYSGDGVVDGTDFLVWRKTPDAYSGAAGYNSWRANFGKTAAGGGSSVGETSVPEPASAMLVYLAATFCYGRWGRVGRRI